MLDAAVQVGASIQVLFDFYDRAIHAIRMTFANKFILRIRTTLRRHLGDDCVLTLIRMVEMVRIATDAVVVVFPFFF
jgi:hypothetical protein